MFVTLVTLFPGVTLFLFCYADRNAEIACTATDVTLVTLVTLPGKHNPI